MTGHRIMHRAINGSVRCECERTFQNEVTWRAHVNQTREKQ